jgi:hypothetical protein
MRALLLAAIVALSLGGSIAGCGGCPTALAEGVLVAQGSDLLLKAPTGEVNTVVWPSGYRVVEDGGKLALTDFFGTIKAREGDAIGVGGGVGTDDLFHGCGDVWVVTPAAAWTGALRAGG